MDMTKAYCQPQVTAIVAAKDAEDTIEASVMSLLDQKGDFRLHVVVVDDASRDATAAKVLGISSDRVTLIESREAIGRGAARNLAAASRTADFLVIQDADDIALPGRVASTLALFAGLSTVVVGGQAVFVDERLGPWRLRRYPTSDEEIRAELLSGRMALCHTGCIVRRSAFDEVGGYDPSFIRAQDFELMRRLIATGSAAAVSRDVVVYRHPVVLSLAYWRQSRTFAERAATLEGRRAPVHQVMIRGRARYLLSTVRRVLIFAVSTIEARRSMRSHGPA
jgi:glycosyltransferase involved in cell wall biosynthesis